MSSETSQLPTLTVCGAGAAGRAIAADCAFKGCEVTLFDLPPFGEAVARIAARGGIEVTPDSETTSGKTGFVSLARATTDAALTAGSDVIMVTAPAMYHDVFVDALLPHLSAGQTILFNTGYWGSLRQRARLGGALPDVTLAESNIMPYICQLRGDAVQVGRFKRGFELAAFPGNRIESLIETARLLYRQYRPVPSVLDSNIAAAGNPPIHATLAIPVAGFYFDRYMGGKFYQDATVPGARLVTAHDTERERLSRALGCDTFESQFDFDKRAYGYDGRDIAEALRASPHSDWFATAAYLEQVISEDIVYAYVPMVRLAAQIGVELPVTRGMVDVMGVMLGRDYWAQGLRLDQLGLDGMDVADIRRFVTTGEA
jgi:opine dehydrogenase